MQTYVNNIMSLKLVMSIIVAFLVAGSLLFVSKDPVVIVLVLLITFYSILQSFILFFYSFFQGIEDMQYNFIGKLFNALSLILFVAIVIYKNAGLYGVALAYVGSIIVTFILIILIVKKHTQNLYLAFDIPLWKKIMHDSWPFLAGIVSIMVYVNSDTVLLSFFRNYTEVGIYQAAYKIFFAFQSINLIHQVIYPKLAKLRQEKEDKKFNKLVRHIILYSAIALIPLGILVTILSKQIIILIYGNSFQAASFPLIFLIWTGILIHFSTFWSNNLIIDNRQKLWFKAALGGAIINFLLNLIFIPFYGYKAASIITLVSEFVVFLIVLYSNDKRTRNFFK